MRLFLFAALLSSVVMAAPGWATGANTDNPPSSETSEPAAPASRVPVCKEVMASFLSLSYEARTLAAHNIAQTAIHEKDTELREIAAAAGIKKIEQTSLSYTIYNENNGFSLQCNGTVLSFKPGETMVQVKVNYELSPIEAVSAFTDQIIKKGYVPSVSELKRSVCE